MKQKQFFEGFYTFFFDRGISVICVFVMVRLDFRTKKATWVILTKMEQSRRRKNKETDIVIIVNGLGI